MKIPAPKSAYRSRKDGVWDAFISDMHEHDEIFVLVWWWGSVDTRKRIAEMPPIWQELAAEAYDERLEKLRARL